MYQIKYKLILNHFKYQHLTLQLSITLVTHIISDTKPGVNACNKPEGSLAADADDGVVFDRGPRGVADHHPLITLENLHNMHPLLIYIDAPTL